jgi:hypothetical protein
MTVFYDESIGVKNSKVFDAVIDWTWKRLNLNGDIDITYSLDNLTNDEQGDLRGYCLCDPEDTQEFEIFICKTMQRTDMMITIMHEMVHASQHSEGRPLCEDEAYRMEKELYNEFMGVNIT